MWANIFLCEIYEIVPCFQSALVPEIKGANRKPNLITLLTLSDFSSLIVVCPIFKHTFARHIPNSKSLQLLHD